MATKKYTDPGLASASPLTGAEQWGVARSGADKYVTTDMVKTYINPMTTAGDLIKGGVSGALARLGIGSTGDVLTVVAGAPAWAAPAGGSSTGLVARYHLTSDLTLANSAATRFNATVQDYDPGSDVTTGASWVYTVPTTAWYEVKLTFALLISDGNAWQDDKGAEANLKMNAGTYVGMMRYERTNSADSTSQFLHMGGSLSVSCTAGDTLYVEIFNGTGAARKMEADSTIEIYKVT